MDRSFDLTLLVGYAVMAVLLFAVSIKAQSRGKRRLWGVCAAILAAGCVAAGANLWVGSETLLLLTSLCPLGLSMLLLGLGQTGDYRHCILPVEAVCVGSLEQRRRHIVTLHPRFRYRVDGKAVEALGINTYSKDVFAKRFPRRNTAVTIHVNPKDPAVCVYKPDYSCGRAVCLCTFGGILIVLAVAVTAVTLFR